jgi:nucleoid-associated protein YgaU
MATITLAAPASRPSAGVRVVSSNPVPVRRPEAPKSVSRTGSTPSPLRLTARGRRLARTLIVALALVAALAVALAWRTPSVAAGDSAALSATTTVVVQPGQTLWQLARDVAPNSDVRETIARIKDLNGLSGAGSSAVLPGQQLVVPAAG